MARIKITDSPTQELSIEDAVKKFDLYKVDELIRQIVDFLGTETSLLHKKFVNLYSTAYEIVLADIKQKYNNLNIIKLLTDWYTIWVRYISHVDFLLDGFTDKCRTSIRYVYRARTDNTNISFRKDEKEAAQTMNLSAFSTNFLNMGKAAMENLFPNAFAIGEKRDKAKVSLKESINTLMDYGFSIIGGELDAMRRTLINQAEALNCALKKSYNVECVSEFSDRGRSMYFVNRTTREKYLDLQPTKRVIEDGLALINGSNKKIVLQLLSGDIEYDEYRFDFDAITDNHPVFMQSKLIKDDKHSSNKDDSWPSAIDKIDKKRKREERSISINSRDSGSSLIPMKNSIELPFADKSYKSSGTKKRKLFSCPRSEDFPNSHSQNPIVPSTGVVSESELCATLEDLIESDIDDAEEDEEASISEYLVAEKQFIFLNGDDSIQNNEIVRKLVLGKFDKIIADERDLIKIYWEFILNNFDYEVAMESGEQLKSVIKGKGKLPPKISNFIHINNSNLAEAFYLVHIHLQEKKLKIDEEDDLSNFWKNVMKYFNHAPINHFVDLNVALYGKLYSGTNISIKKMLWDSGKKRLAYDNNKQLDLDDFQNDFAGICTIVNCAFRSRKASERGLSIPFKTRVDAVRGVFKAELYAIKNAKGRSESEAGIASAISPLKKTQHVEAKAVITPNDSELLIIEDDTLNASEGTKPKKFIGSTDEDGIISHEMKKESDVMSSIKKIISKQSEEGGIYTIDRGCKLPVVLSNTNVQKYFADSNIIHHKVISNDSDVDKKELQVALQLMLTYSEDVINLYKYLKELLTDNEDDDNLDDYVSKVMMYLRTKGVYRYYRCCKNDWYNNTPSNGHCGLLSIHQSHSLINTDPNGTLPRTKDVLRDAAINSSRSNQLNHFKEFLNSFRIAICGQENCGKDASVESILRKISLTEEQLKDHGPLSFYQHLVNGKGKWFTNSDMMQTPRSYAPINLLQIMETSNVEYLQVPKILINKNCGSWATYYCSNLFDQSLRHSPHLSSILSFEKMQKIAGSASFTVFDTTKSHFYVVPTESKTNELATLDKMLKDIARLLIDRFRKGRCREIDMLLDLQINTASNINSFASVNEGEQTLVGEVHTIDAIAVRLQSIIDGKNDEISRLVHRTQVLEKMLQDNNISLK